jgi:hypothetical protein
MIHRSGAGSAGLRTPTGPGGLSMIAAIDWAGVSRWKARRPVASS